MDKKRLLVLTSTFPLSKDDNVSARFVYDSAKSLTAYYDVSVLCPHGWGASTHEKIEGMEVRRFRYAIPTGLEMLVTGEGMLTNIRSNPLLVMLLPVFLLCELIAFIQEIRRNRIDIVNTHWMIPQGLVAAIAKRSFGFRHVMTVHAADIFSLKRYGRFGKMLGRFIIRNTDMVLPVSTYIRDVIEEVAGAGFDHRIISMGADIERFKPAPQRQDSTFTYLFVGKIVEKKGLRFLLEAVKELDNDQMRFQLIVVGGGRSKEKMQAHARSLGIADKVRFLGWVNHAGLAQIYNESDVVVVPSVFDHKGETEGMPTVIPEAMACGIPVIASNISGIPDIVKDGYNGWLTIPGDPMDLAQKMRSVYNCKDMKAYRDNCVNTAAAYSWKNRAQAYYDAIESVKGR